MIRLLPALAILGAGGIWGLFWLPMRTLKSAQLPADWLTLLLFAIPALLLLPAVLWRRRMPSGLVLAVLITGICTGAGSALYAVSLVLTTVVKALLLFYITPVWSTIFEYFLFGENLRRSRIVALVLGVLGLMVILDTGGIPVPSNIGDWLALLSGIVWAYGTVRLHSQQYIPICESLFAYFFGGAVVAAGIILLNFDALPGNPDIQIIVGKLPEITAIAIGLLLVSMFLIYWGALRLSPARVGLLLMSEVIVGITSAAWLTVEPFGSREIIGSTLIVSAVLVEIFEHK